MRTTILRSGAFTEPEIALRWESVIGVLRSNLLEWGHLIGVILAAQTAACGGEKAAEALFCELETQMAAISMKVDSTNLFLRKTVPSMDVPAFCNCRSTFSNAPAPIQPLLDALDEELKRLERESRRRIAQIRRFSLI